LTLSSLPWSLNKVLLLCSNDLWGGYWLWSGALKDQNFDSGKLDNSISGLYPFPPPHPTSQLLVTTNLLFVCIDLYTSDISGKRKPTVCLLLYLVFFT
jgi:hypothetical protein